ncbi:hypothetical protein [Streptomyces mutabilis]|uniref:Uncharacterized protein n=1 Tax=Streptomyces mutabilis TaxID=67332 RepID=A0A086N2Y3_9ACTN|nr:hypothetical protein [Streptomyces mutabilis]KFG75501.1 hypothetical protein FM21_05015 [Streptomyces mutabilis]
MAAGQNPAGRDPAGRHPAGRDPAGRHPAGQDPAGHNALMAAITGEPLPPGAGADAHGAYRSAAADVALLREELDVLGRVLSQSPAEPQAAGTAPRTAVHRPRRRSFRLALGVLAAACAGAVVTGLGWLVVQTGGGTDDAAGQAASGAQQDGSASGAAPDQDAGLVFGTPRYLACARLVAEGTVTGADPVPGEARHRITLRVTRSYAPAASAPPQASTGPGTGTGPAASIGPRPVTEPVTFLLDDATARLRPGDRVLVGVWRDGTGADTVFTGERNIATARTWITASLPESRTLTCD